MKAPNYLSGIIIRVGVYSSISKNLLPYTIPQNGWLQIMTAAYSVDKSGISATKVYINGQSISNNHSGSSGSENDKVNIESIWPVKKGDVVSSTQFGHGGFTIIFYPSH